MKWIGEFYEKSCTGSTGKETLRKRKSFGWRLILFLSNAPKLSIVLSMIVKSVSMFNQSMPLTT